jgi:hypothetical protein
VQTAIKKFFRLILRSDNNDFLILDLKGLGAVVIQSVHVCACDCAPCFLQPGVGVGAWMMGMSQLPKRVSRRHRTEPCVRAILPSVCGHGSASAEPDYAVLLV